jgi:hypothetical protein
LFLSRPFIFRAKSTSFVRTALAAARQIRSPLRAGRRQNQFDLRPAMFIVGELLIVCLSVRRSFS